VTAKKNPRARWTLPDPVNPSGRVCFEIKVPNEKHHIAAFLGAIFDLTKPYNWANDDAHTALQVGALWFDIFERLRRNNCTCVTGGAGTGDDQMLRVNPDNPCELQEFCGGEWVHFWGSEDCAALAGVGQPTAQGGTQPATGECQTYDLVLQGNGLWLLPVQVSQGNTIELSDFTGAWTDGTLLWFCPDGQHYVLGGCAGGQSTSGGDPLPSAYHGGLIALIDGVYYPAYAGVITVPAGVSLENAQFQMNDSNLVGNGGTITAKVKICNSGPTDVTFTSLNGNTLPVPNPAHVGDTFTWPIDADAGGFFYSDLSMSPCATVEVLLNNQTNAFALGVNEYPCGGGAPIQHAQGFTGMLGSAERIIYQTADQSQGTPLVSIRVVSIP